MTPENVQSKKWLAYFWETYFNWQYYLLVCPFRLQLQPQDPCNPKSHPHYRIQSWLPQKLGCGVLTILCLSQTLHILFHTIPTNPKDPSMYFSMAYFAIITLYKVVILKLYWLHQVGIARIANFLLDVQNNIPTPAASIFPLNSKGKYIFCILRISNTALTIGQWFYGNGTATYPKGIPVAGQIGGWNLKWLWSTLVVSGIRSTLVVGNVTGHHEWVISDSAYPFSAVETFLGVLTACGTFCRLILNSQAELIMIISSVTLRIVASTFGEMMEQLSKKADPCSTCHWVDIRKQYLAMKQLAVLINQTLGANITLFLLETIVYYSVSFDKILIAKDFPKWAEVVPVFFYCLTTIVIFLVSGSVSGQVGK